VLSNTLTGLATTHVHSQPANTHKLAGQGSARAHARDLGDGSPAPACRLAGQGGRALGISRWDIFDVMGRYQAPAIDLTPEELKEGAFGPSYASRNLCR
jgi:hypothetical protein